MPPLNNFQKTCLALAIGASLTQPLQAATITVNSEGDNGAGSSICTLREAIISSNRSGSVYAQGCVPGEYGVSDDIVFANNVNTITLTDDLPNITKDVTISGTDSNQVTIDGNNNKMLWVFWGRDRPTVVEMSNLTLTGGNCQACYGGAITAFSLYRGTMINLDNMTITGNTASRGGGISSGGYLDISNSIIYDNTALYTGGGLDINGRKTTITNSTIAGNKAYSGNNGYDRGGGIALRSSERGNAELELIDSTVSQNRAANGGGIYSKFGIINITNSSITENNASDSQTREPNGAAIYSRYGSITVTDSSISDNYTSGSGAIYASNSYVTINNSSVSQNTVSKKGGAIYSRYGTNDIIDSTLSGNTASDKGGGVYFYKDNSSSIINSTLSANSASLNGGGIYSNGGTTIITNTTVSGNSAGNAGGGVLFFYGTTAINNSTLSANSAEYGGGLFTASTTLTLGNNIIAGNTASSNQGIEITDVFGASSIQSQNNLLGSSANTTAEAFFFVPSSSDLVATSDDLNVSLNQILSTLADNDGPTLTHNLADGSPAIDAGSNTSCPSRDQRGVARNDGNCDIGAVEIESDVAANTFYVIPLANGGSVVIEL